MSKGLLIYSHFTVAKLPARTVSQFVRFYDIVKPVWCVYKTGVVLTKAVNWLVLSKTTTTPEAVGTSFKLR